MQVFAGYPYWLKNDVKVDEVVKMLEIPKNCDGELLAEAVDRISGQKLPESGVLWSFHVGTVPLVTQQKVKKLVIDPSFSLLQHILGWICSLSNCYLHTSQYR